MLRKTRLPKNRDLPVPDSQRRCTDIWWLLIPLIGISFFIYCMVVFNAEYVRLMSSPVDGTGVVCGHGNALEYPYLYVANPLKAHKRICVRTCPFNITRISGVRYNLNRGTRKIGSSSTDLQGEHPFLAEMNADKIYDSVVFDTARGGFCLPVDLLLRDQLLINTNMTWWMGFLANFDLIWILTGFSIILCGIYFALLLYYPLTMDIAMPTIGGFILSTFGVNLVFYTTRFEVGFNRVMFGLFIFVFGALMILCCWFYKKQLKAHGMFLEHAGKIIKSRMNVLVHIFIFILLCAILLGICFYEYLAVWTTLPPTFDLMEMYYQTNSHFSYLFTAWIFFQAYWGLNFLKQAFNYTVSSITADYYFNQSITRGLFTPYYRLLRYHLGSIYYSSFVSSIFQPLSFIQSITSPREMTIRLDRSCSAIWLPCMKFLEFVRPDSIVILDTTGYEYKNCVGYRNQLCEDLSLYRDIHVASRLFRIGSYGFIIGLIGYFALYVRHTMVLSALVMLFILLIVISMFFVGMYADIAQALNILFLADQYRTEGYPFPLTDPQNPTDIYNPNHKVISQFDHPMNRQIYNPINEQLARQGNREVNELGHLTGEIDIVPESRVSRQYNPSTLSQRVEDQLGYNFKKLAETGIR